MLLMFRLWKMQLGGNMSHQCCECGSDNCKNHECKPYERRYSIADLKKGDKAIVKHIPKSDVKDHLTRVGLIEGIQIECTAVSFGSFSIKFENQEMAVGNSIGKSIKIERV